MNLEKILQENQQKMSELLNQNQAHRAELSNAEQKMDGIFRNLKLKSKINM